MFIRINGTNEEAPESRSSEHGAVMLEWAIVVTGLMMGFLVFVDLANMLSTYVLLSQAAFEGVRAGGNYPQLEEGANTDLTPTAEEVAACTSSAVATPFACGHFYVQKRIRTSLTDSAALTGGLFSSPGLSITSQFVSASPPGGDRNISVSVTARYSGLVFHNMPLWASYEGPYLFR